MSDPNQILIGWPRDQGSDSSSRHQLNKRDAIRLLTDADSRIRQNSNVTTVMSLLVKRLDGSNRVDLMSNISYGDLRNRRKGQSQHALKNAFDDDDTYTRLSELVFNATGKYLGLSPVSPVGSISAYLTQDDVASGMLFNVRSLDYDASDYYSDESKALPIALQSDGTRAYSGLALELLAGPESLLLIDEPEAFLHPTLSRMLGATVGRESSSKQVIVATHSADFLLGCLESGTEVNIVRLTREGDVSQAHLLDRNSMRRMIYDPLLRSENIIGGLFHNVVVVVEGDSDQAFYREINYRIGACVNDSPIRGEIFVNSHGISSEKRIVALMRDAGIPTPCIVDFDFLAKKGDDFGGLLSSAKIPSPLISSLKTQRSQISEHVRHCKELHTGLDGLDAGTRSVAEIMIRELKDYGVFVVPVGEVENWLTNLGVSKDKEGWIERIFNAMGSDPNQEGYVQPAAGDVWDFVRDIAKWTEDPHRKGMCREE